MSHGQTICRACNSVLSQCRCMDHDRVTRYVLCNDCQPKRKPTDCISKAMDWPESAIKACIGLTDPEKQISRLVEKAKFVAENCGEDGIFELTVALEPFKHMEDGI